MEQIFIWSQTDKSMGIKSNLSTQYEYQLSYYCNLSGKWVGKIEQLKSFNCQTWPSIQLNQKVLMPSSKIDIYVVSVRPNIWRIPKRMVFL